MKKYGLIGYPLTHSFSKKYFSDKFRKEGLDNRQYELYEIKEIGQLKEILVQEPDLIGLNVTIPYKEKVIPFLDELDPACQNIGAVNCIKIHNKKLKGYNTDYFGFKDSLVRWLGMERPKALVLGTGGASKAVKEALKDLQMEFLTVSRNPSSLPGFITYSALNTDENILKEFQLIINTTPLGTYPDTEVMPAIPVNQISPRHKVYDLVYNPERTLLMKSLEAKGAAVKNGMEMLHLQAEAAWDIWN